MRAFPNPFLQISPLYPQFHHIKQYLLIILAYCVSDTSVVGNMSVSESVQSMQSEIASVASEANTAIEVVGADRDPPTNEPPTLLDAIWYANAATETLNNLENLAPRVWGNQRHYIEQIELVKEYVDLMKATLRDQFYP